MAVKKYDIEIPKMDYRIIEISIKENGKLIKLEESDNIYFTVKKDPNDETPLLQKELNNGITYNESTKKYEIEITSNDTKEMIMGDINGMYGYDITIYYEGNKPKQKVIGSLKIGDKYTLNEVS